MATLKYVLLCCLVVLLACQRPVTFPTLEGHRKEQQILESFYSRQGTLRARKRLLPTASSFAALTITKDALVYHFRGDSTYPVVQPFSRQGDTLRIVADGEKQQSIITTIKLLSAHQLVLHLAQPYSPDSSYNYSEYDTFLKR
jgi:phosphotransferase system HPr-like phosphotransfer protein